MKSKWLRLSIVSAVAFVAVQVFRAQVPVEPYQTIYWLFAIANILIGVAFGSAVVNYVMEWRTGRQEEIDLWDQTKAEPKDTTKLPKRWCPDCGQQAIYFQKQKGFDHLTGKGSFSSLVGCPDWDMVTTYEKQDAKRSAAYASAMSSGVPPTLTSMSIFDRSDRPEVESCGNVTAGSWTSTQVHAHDESQVDSTCIRCLLDMAQMSVISKDELSQKLRELGKTA